MWQIIINNPSIFYGYRAQFVPHMVNSLNKLGLQPNCLVENRTLAINLADLIIAWEVHRLDRVRADALVSAETQAETQAEDAMDVDDDEGKGKKGKAAGKKKGKRGEAGDGEGGGAKKRKGGEGEAVEAGGKGGGGGGVEDDFKPTQAMIGMVSNFLLRLAILTADAKDAQTARLAPRSVVLFNKALSVWGKSVVVSFRYVRARERSERASEASAKERGEQQRQASAAEHRDRVCRVPLEPQEQARKSSQATRAAAASEPRKQQWGSEPREQPRRNEPREQQRRAWRFFLRLKAKRRLYSHSSPPPP
jgi:hypothetical protein